MRIQEQAPRAVDWESIDRVLCRPVMNGGFGFTLEQAYHFTFSEIDFYLDLLDDKPKAPGIAVATQEQANAYAEWWRSLTALQKIEMALEQRG